MRGCLYVSLLEFELAQSQNILNVRLSEWELA